MKPVSVLLIGMGRVGSRFYEKFRELGENRVRIAGVCEIDSRHPLLQRAREAGVPVYEDYRAALTLPEHPVDIVLDTTNLPEVKNGLRHLLQETGNHHTVLLPLVASYLLWHMASPGEDLPEDHADPGY
ncbi:MAG: Gfo/Idh/MocA family oxidoreductase [Nitrospirae bacterium]|jgi:homoserine dehydrogenase|nr:Gfo/Idh/MocA family oxidoreductase [Nitrospirota bacterium]